MQQWRKIRKPAEHLLLYRHRLTGLRAFLLFCVLQAGLVVGRKMTLCPVGPSAADGPTTPAITLQSELYRLHLRMMAASPVSMLLERIGPAAAIRPAIGNGIDLLFFGI